MDPYRKEKNKDIKFERTKQENINIIFALITISFIALQILILFWIYRYREKVLPIKIIQEQKIETIKLVNEGERKDIAFQLFNMSEKLECPHTNHNISIISINERIIIKCICKQH